MYNTVQVVHGPGRQLRKLCLPPPLRAKIQNILRMFFVTGVRTEDYSCDDCVCAVKNLLAINIRYRYLFYILVRMFIVHASDKLII